MNSQHLIPVIWFRLVVLIGFAVFVGFQKMWLLLGIAVLLGILTGWQLITAYNRR
ncbi:hypothetical protein ACL1HS_01860 [Corynebacterium striatum]|uniref:hypothetical protein n=1 Tax=Corynebacterium TaxID=1716 RepID=UPI000673D086|nr:MULTISPECIES: hypothetical protein [Corynebacterium]MCG7250075.1 hypothetical protein [Corynebacterium striatum]QQU79702.1 hypothetical protein I6I73_01295 [Corynebacterium striatum]QRP18147.1 hypothetical protein I6J27_09470 [Corynebacterium striatum]TXS64008.1 hypothetical protein CHU71_06680 [Corynebacterium sp. LK14]CQD11597.1 conserved hypothetical protein [Corynebacterium striatum]